MIQRTYLQHLLACSDCSRICLTEPHVCQLFVLSYKLQVTAAVSVHPVFNRHHELSNERKRVAVAVQLLNGIELRCRAPD